MTAHQFYGFANDVRQLTVAGNVDAALNGHAVDMQCRDKYNKPGLMKCLSSNIYITVTQISINRRVKLRLFVDDLH